MEDPPVCLLPPGKPEVANSLSSPALAFSWGLGNELFIHDAFDSSSLQRSRVRQGKNSNFSFSSNTGASSTNSAYFVSWGATSYHRRSLLTGSLPLFCQFHSSRANKNLEGRWMLDWSRRMSSLLLRTAEETNGERDEQSVATFREELAMRAVWDLAEVTYLHSGSDEDPAELLANWLSEHSADLGEKSAWARINALQEELTTWQAPEEAAEYWKGITTAASIGWLSPAILLLRQHSSYKESEIISREDENGLVEAVAVLLGSMPRFRSDLAAPLGPFQGKSFSSRSTFMKERETWLTRLARLEMSPFWVKCLNPHTVQGLQHLLRLLMGRRDALESVSSHWLELLTARLLHSPPRTLGREGLRALALQCQEQLTSGSSEVNGLSAGTPGLDSLMTAVLGRDTEVVVSESSRMFSTWFVAHIVDLLYQGGGNKQQVLTEEREGLGSLSLLEFYRLQYAQDLLSNAATWQLAPPYLAMCLKQGQMVLEEALSRQPRGDDLRAPYKALEVCRLYNLPAPASAICKSLGMRYWEKGCHGAAITWLRRACDDARLKAVGNALLNRLIQQPGQQSPGPQLQDLGPLLADLGVSAGSTDTLSFLHKYQELQALLRQVNEASEGGTGLEEMQASDRQSLAKAASNCLLALLEPGMTPPFLFLSILESAIVLLEWPDEPLLDVAESQTLLGSLQDFCLWQRGRKAHRSSPQGSSSDLPAIDERLQRIRLAVGVNLGRAILGA